MARDSLADDAAGERVADETHIRDPGPGRDIGPISHPQGVGPISGEVPIDKIRRPRRGVVAFRGAHTRREAAIRSDSECRMGEPVRQSWKRPRSDRTAAQVRWRRGGGAYRTVAAIPVRCND
jgi:hypothetical protein